MIQFLNKYGTNIGYRDYIEVQWVRRWSDCGEFTIFMAAKNYDNAIKYVVNAGRPETGLVQKIEYAENEKGEFITLSGFFIEKVADFGANIFNNEYEFTGENEVALGLFDHLSWCLTDPKNKPTAPYPFPWNTYTIEMDTESEYPNYLVGNLEKFTPAGKGLYNMLSGTNYSYICSPIFAPAELEDIYPLLGLKFKIKKARDLTEKVYFGEQYYNVAKTDYKIDETAEKPYYIIIQEVPSPNGWSTFDNIAAEWRDGAWVYLAQTSYKYEPNSPTGLGNCLPHKVFQSQIDNVELIPVNQNKIVEQMKSQAQLDMLNNYKIETIEIDVLQNRFLYLKDYDLGDKCTVVIPDIEQMYSVRIEEIREVHKDNRINIEVVLGTPQKIEWRKL